MIGLDNYLESQRIDYEAESDLCDKCPYMFKSEEMPPCDFGKKLIDYAYKDEEIEWTEEDCIYYQEEERKAHGE